MKQSFLLGIVLLLTGFSRAQVTINDPNAQTRTASGYHGVNVQNGITLYLSSGQEESVAVSANKEEYLAHLITEVKDGILHIKVDNKLNRQMRKEKWDMKAYVSYKLLDKLVAGTGADVHLTAALQTDKLSLELSTGAKLDGKINATELKMSQSTGAKAVIDGTVHAFTMDADTGCKFDGDDLASDECTARVSTGAKISVRVNTRLEAHANTGAQIHYTGSVTQISTHTNTGGRVSKI